MRVLPGVFVAAVLCFSPAGYAAELVARGLSFPFFDETGILTHKLMAREGTMSGGVQRLSEVEIEYYADGVPSRVVQRVTAAQAIWHEKREILEGEGAISVETERNRITGRGFRFELARSQLNIHRDFGMQNAELLLTSDRAIVDLVLERAGDEVKLRDVKRCEAFGNLVIKVLPTAAKDYNFDEARSTRAIYDGATHAITLPEEARLLKDGRASTAQHTRYTLDPATRPALKLSPAPPAPAATRSAPRDRGN